MFRTIVIVLSLHVAACYVPKCTRPVINHWLEDDSLRNESFTLFGDHPAHKKEIYFTLMHSGCMSSTGGKTRLFCNGYSFSLDCQRGDSTFKPHQIILGLGQQSVIWNHYKRLILTEDTITFGDSDLEFPDDDGIKLTCKNQDFDTVTREREALCTHKEGEMIYGINNELKANVNIVLFADTLSTIVPQDVYGLVISGTTSFHYKSQYDSDVIKCGENCIWTSDIWKENRHALVRGINNENLILGTLARHQLKISYDATGHFLHIAPVKLSSKYTKITSQLILIFKLGILCFLGTTTSVKTYNSNISKFISTIAVFIGLEILLFAHSITFRVSGLGQIGLLLALNMMYDKSFKMGGQPQATILALVLIQSTLIELSFFELSILALLAHGVITITTLVKLILNDARQLALLFSGFVIISIILVADVLQSDLDQFKCLFGLPSSLLLYVFFQQISVALSLEWVLREKSN